MKTWAVCLSSRVDFDESGRFAGLTSDPRVAQSQRVKLAGQGFTTSPGYTGASNYWAVRGLEDARAVLVNGPQFGFSTPGYVYGIDLHGGDFNVVGYVHAGRYPQRVAGHDPRLPVPGDGRFDWASLRPYSDNFTIMEAWVRRLLADILKDDVGEEMFHLYSATNYPHGPLGPSIPNPPGVKALVRNLDSLAADEKPDYEFFNGVEPAQLLRGALVASVAELEKAQGEDQSAWALESHPMRWKPYNFRGAPQASESSGHKLPGYLNRGSENNQFVATGEGIVAKDVIPPGQSGFVGNDAKASAHYSDQMSLYTDYGYKEVPFTLEEVKAAAVSSVSLRLRLVN